MKRSTFKVLFYLKRDKVKKNGNVPVFCRITVDGKETRFGMKKDINPKLWDVSSGKAIGRTSEANEINMLLESTKSAIYKVYRDLQEKENSVTAEKIKNNFLGIGGKCQYFLELFDQHNKERELLVGINISKSTYGKYCTARSHLADYLKKWHNLSDIPLKEIDHKFVCDFENYLLIERHSSENTIVKYMKMFKHIVSIAIKYKWIYDDPFVGYKFRFKAVDRGYLTQEEVETLINHKFEERHLEKVRDVFVFCCFTGLAYIDVHRLTQEDVKISFDGGKWLIGNRGKTGVRYNVPLLDIPKMILEKYKGKLSGTRALPVTSNRCCNLYLQKIGKICKLKKHLTFHLSRHTFATLTLSKGVSIESVSKMLGHTNIQTTQIYARITNEKIGNDMAMFSEKINGMGTKSQENDDNLKLAV